MSSPAVAVSTVARFHHFDLARQLYERGALSKLYTGYPSWKVDNLPRELVRTFPAVVPLEMCAYKWGFDRLGRRLSPISHLTLDRWVSKRLNDADVLVANHGNGLLSFVAATKLGMKCVCDVGIAHSDYVESELRPEFLRWRAEYVEHAPGDMARRLAEYDAADLITVPSEFVKETFRSRGFPDHKIAKIPYGVNLTTFQPVPCLRPQRFRVICVGYLGLRKGLPYLLEAFEKMPRNAELVLIGGFAPDAAPVLRQFARRTHFISLGVLSRTELYQEYSKASVCVLPSLVEGLSLSLVQAMACGVPIVATRNTGIEDVLTDGVEGYIIAPRSAVDLRDKLMTLYEDAALRERMAHAALARVRQLGGWRAYGDGVVTAYTKLCA